MHTYIVITYLLLFDKCRKNSRYLHAYFSPLRISHSPGYAWNSNLSNPVMKHLSFTSSRAFVRAVLRKYVCPRI